MIYSLDIDPIIIRSKLDKENNLILGPYTAYYEINLRYFLNTWISTSKKDLLMLVYPQPLHLLYLYKNQEEDYIFMLIIMY